MLNQRTTLSGQPGALLRQRLLGNGTHRQEQGLIVAINLKTAVDAILGPLSALLRLH
jgi:hypothetical protein